MKQIKFKIYTLGCKVNQYDSGKLSAYLENYGMQPVVSDADIAIINTCTVTRSAIAKNKQIINKARHESPGAKIVVMGCWPATDKLSQTELKVDIIMKGRDNKTVLKEIKKLFGEKHVVLPDSNNNLAVNDKARYFITIQDGCEQFCSYCIIPFARGPIKSRPATEIIAEIKAAIVQGYREFVLSGIHLGQYGKDLGDINLVKLLQQILKLDGLGRVRLSSIEINEVSDNLIRLIATDNKMCPHLHIPLQAGCDKIIQLMNRPYNLKFFEERIVKIKKALPSIALTTDVIVGFPGETELDFLETYNFIKKIEFSRLHVFPFSAHARTKAFSLPNQISEQIKKDRARRLQKLDGQLRHDYRQKFNNKIVNVLIEKKEQGIYYGKSEYYFEVKFRPDQLTDSAQLPLSAVREVVKINMALLNC
jgi:threonylcarbamoyladenosine tRNA methylthiotransferase MtaB